MNACTATAQCTTTVAPNPIWTTAYAWARNFAEWLASRARKARDREALAQMSDRDLRDIGVDRGFIDDVANGTWRRDIAH